MVDVNKIDMYERGELDGHGALQLFAALIKTGEAWQLQGHYGRTCDRMIKEGWITPEGEIITADDFE